MMTELKDIQYMGGNNLLNEELFFQLQKLTKCKLQFNVIELNKKYVVIKYEFVFIGYGHHDFLNLQTIMMTQLFYRFIHSQHTFDYCSQFNSSFIFKLSKLCQRKLNRHTSARG